MEVEIVVKQLDVCGGCGGPFESAICPNCKRCWLPNCPCNTRADIKCPVDSHSLTWPWICDTAALCETCNKTVYLRDGVWSF